MGFNILPAKLMRSLIKLNALPIKLLDKFLPKDKNKVIFCSYPDFTDSAYIFYEFLKDKKQDKFKKIIWLKENSESCNSKINHKIQYLYSLKGILNLITSKYIIHDHSSEFLDYIASNKRVLFNLWHGMPIKAIGKLDCGLSKNTKKRYKYISKNSCMFVISDIYRMILSSTLDIDPKKIFVTGQARTDSIFHSKGQEIKDKLQLNGFKNIVLYMPTYKSRAKNKDVEITFDNIFYLDKYSDSDFLNFLKSNEILFVIKSHPFEEEDFKKKAQNSQLINQPNIRLLYSNDFTQNNIFLNELFVISDLMISDFSSVTIDYSILKKPILYLGNYLEQYKKGRNLILPDNYKMMMPGENVEDYEVLKSKILECLTINEVNYKKEEVDILHKYQDRNSCERIFEVMKGF